MALSVIAVSSTVSPLETAEVETAMFMTSAPSRLPAISKELCVRVEASKNRLIWVRPGENRMALVDLPADLDIALAEIEER